MEENEFDIQFNGADVSLFEPNKYFFIAGLYGGAQKMLHGQIPIDQPFLAGVLQFPQQRFFRNTLTVKKTSISVGNKLRLPANVRKRLDNADEQQKMADRITVRSALKTEFVNESRPCWQRPVHSKITSQFARPRTLPSGRSYYHSGVDLRAWTGTPIQVASAGRVVYAGHMLVPGNNVVVSHGHGLFSRYMHLNKINVRAGDSVLTGQTIGLAGATGRVEAPHLHWEVIWKGNHADPLRFVQDWEQICDRELIE